MNIPQTQAPNGVTTRTAKKATNELKTKSRTAGAGKKSVLRAKNSAPKRKAAGRVRTNAKSTSRKLNHVLVNDGSKEQIAAIPQSCFSVTDLPIQDEQPAIAEPAVEQTFLAEDVSLEPVRFEDRTECHCDDLDDIAAAKFREPTLTADLAPEAIALNELATPAEMAAPCEDDAAVSELSVPELVKENPAAPLVGFWKSMASQITGLWNWIQEKFKSHQVRKRLRVCETVSLGEKRFLAVVQVDGEQFLVGGSSSSVSTLAHLERSRDFSDVFQGHCGQDFSQA